MKKWNIDPAKVCIPKERIVVKRKTINGNKTPAKTQPHRQNYHDTTHNLARRNTQFWNTSYEPKNTKRRRRSHNVFVLSTISIENQAGPTQQHQNTVKQHTNRSSTHTATQQEPQPVQRKNLKPFLKKLQSRGRIFLIKNPWYLIGYSSPPRWILRHPTPRPLHSYSVLWTPHHDSVLWTPHPVLTWIVDVINSRLFIVSCGDEN